NSRSNSQARAVLRTVFLDNEGHFGPGTDKRHVSPEDVEQLRQFIQAQAPQQSSDARNARISRADGRTMVAGSILIHRAELIHTEELAVAADASLREESRPGGIEPDQKTDEQKQGDQPRQQQ